MSDPGQRTYSSGGIVALIVIGLLLLIPSGLCSATLGVVAVWSAITQPQNAGDALNIVPMIVIVGGPFIVAGGAMLAVGIQRSRANRRSQGPHR